jgi:hypothetical protein
MGIGIHQHKLEVTHDHHICEFKNLKFVFDTEPVGLFVIYLHAKFCLLSGSDMFYI